MTLDFFSSKTFSSRNFDHQPKCTKWHNTWKPLLGLLNMEQHVLLKYIWVVFHSIHHRVSRIWQTTNTLKYRKIVTRDWKQISIIINGHCDAKCSLAVNEEQFKFLKVICLVGPLSDWLTIWSVNRSTISFKNGSVRVSGLRRLSPKCF